ncbi:MAG: FAD-linked oxidase C-terminal domain-containing protein [Planctomycetia bacterium]|nr:FAD-linked oxidase C-terminal domain-containing protein [Planctomycetia bacterium]
MSKLTTFQAMLQDDLRGVIEGDVFCNEVMLQLYATDASMLECPPLGVVFPKTEKDVSAAVIYAAEKGISIHPRGAGTESAGGAIGPGLILDFTRYMRRVLQVDDEAVLVEPGVIRERLNFILRTTKKRFFAPSAGHFPTCTIGGILAADCVGPRWLKHHFPHDYVKELEIVAADGQIYHLRPEKITRDPDGNPVLNKRFLAASSDSSPVPWNTLLNILQRADSAIKMEQRPEDPDRSGYRLEGILKEDVFDPTRLFIGSEGTLGIITKAIVRTLPEPVCSSAIVFLFDSLEKAARSVDAILKFDPVLCDLLDRRIINMLKEWDSRFVPVFPPETEVVLVVELNGETQMELNDRMNRLVNRVRNIEKLSFGSWIAFHQIEREMFRDLLRKAQGALLRIRHPFQIINLFEDIQVPVAHLPVFLHTVQNILKGYGITYSLSGHAGQGQIRILPIMEPTRQNVVEIMQHIAEEISAEVFRLNGTVGSAQGSGRIRSWALPMRYPRLFPFFQEIKDLFDPNNLLNPGIIVPHHEKIANQPDSSSDRMAGSADSADYLPVKAPSWVSLMRHSCPSFESIPEKDGRKKYRTQLEFQLRWDPRQIAEETFQCTGCGLCRIRTAETRMCPNFRFLFEERVAARAKANILRGILESDLDLESLTLDRVRYIADQCISCHCCTTECPAQMDIPKLVFRIKSAWNAAHGLTLGDKLFANIDNILQAVSPFSRCIDRALSKQWMRWLLTRIFGIIQSRKLPRLAKKNFLALFGKKKTIGHGGYRQNRRVALFVDTYTNYFDVPLGEAALKVLEHNGIDVYIPSQQRGSGHLAFVLGDADRAGSIVQKNVPLFNDLIRQGYEVLTVEPVSAVCIRKEYPYVRDDEETALLAEHTTDICSYLYRLHQEGDLKLDFTPVHAILGYHAPCRTIALMEASVAAPTPAEELLHLIPGLTVRRLERGCCGLSSALGMRRENLHMGVRLGRRLFMALREPSIEIGASECNSCKVQMEQGANKPVMHPIKLLACAYGLMPSLLELLDKPKTSDRIS